MIRFDSRFFGPELTTAAARFMPQATAAMAAVRAGSCPGGAYTGWYDWPRRHGLALATEINQFVSSIDVYYDTVVVVGIGGLVCWVPRGDRSAIPFLCGGVGSRRQRR